MANKKSRKTGKIEELPDNASGEFVEYDPARTQADEEVQIESYANDPGAMEIDPKLVEARNALEEQMGGFEAVHDRLEAPSEDSGAGCGNIVGWGIGEKVVGGRFTGELAVKVYVAEKLAASDVSAAALVPEGAGNFRTDVEEVGDVNALRFSGRYRPAPGGSSVGHTRITAGTLGCLVTRSNRHLCILSNNHVLASSNNARPGDAIVQPGPIDGGRDPRDRIGTLEQFVPIQFGGSVPNAVDAAVAWTNRKLCSPVTHSYPINPRPILATLGMSVRKCGRTTEATLGVITGIHVSVRVGYGSSGVALFRNQLQIRGVGSVFSQGGDSGSLVVTAGTRQPVGLLFAGGGDFTFANPIEAVIRALGIRQFIG
jgi:hypothetical protein